MVIKHQRLPSANLPENGNVRLALDDVHVLDFFHDVGAQPRLQQSSPAQSASERCSHTRRARASRQRSATATSAGKKEKRLPPPAASTICPASSTSRAAAEAATTANSRTLSRPGTRAARLLGSSGPRLPKSAKSRSEGAAWIERGMRAGHGR
eukprot:5610153-Prymnesium_polylepis.1